MASLQAAFEEAQRTAVAEKDAAVREALRLSDEAIKAVQRQALVAQRNAVEAERAKHEEAVRQLTARFTAAAMEEQTNTVQGILQQASLERKAVEDRCAAEFEAKTERLRQQAAHERDMAVAAAEERCRQECARARAVAEAAEARASELEREAAAVAHHVQQAASPSWEAERRRLLSDADVRVAEAADEALKAAMSVMREAQAETAKATSALLERSMTEAEEEQERAVEEARLDERRICTLQHEEAMASAAREAETAARAAVREAVREAEEQAAKAQAEAVAAAVRELRHQLEVARIEQRRLEQRLAA